MRLHNEKTVFNFDTNLNTIKVDWPAGHEAALARERAHESITSYCRTLMMANYSRYNPYLESTVYIQVTPYGTRKFVLSEVG